METSCMAFLTKLLSAVYDSLLCFNIEYKISTYLAWPLYKAHKIGIYDKNNEKFHMLKEIL